jgi:hypothetical protein
VDTISDRAEQKETLEHAAAGNVFDALQIPLGDALGTRTGDALTISLFASHGTILLARKKKGQLYLYQQNAVTLLQTRHITIRLFLPDSVTRSETMI